MRRRYAGEAVEFGLVPVVGMDDADVGQGAVALSIVQAVTDHPLVIDAKAHVVDMHVDLGAFRLVQQRAGFHRCRAVRFEYPDQVLERIARVDDVLDDQHVLALYVATDIHEEAHGARRSAAPAIARDSDELDRSRDRQAAGKVGELADIPVLYITQLLGLAMGQPPKEVGLKALIVGADALLAKMNMDKAS